MCGEKKTWHKVVSFVDEVTNGKKAVVEDASI